MLGLTRFARWTQRSQGQNAKPTQAFALCSFFVVSKFGSQLPTSDQQKNPPIMVGFAFSGDLAGARTQDPLLKREMLYQLSYQVKI